MTVFLVSNRLLYWKLCLVGRAKVDVHWVLSIRYESEDRYADTKLDI